MTNELRSRVSGQTIEESIAATVRDLIYDEIGVPLSTIITCGRHSFGLEGDDLVAYVRRAVAALAAFGATPEHWEGCTPPHVPGPIHYGTDTPDEIAEGVFAEWVAEGMPKPAWADFRFNTAENRATIDEIREWNRTGVPPRKKNAG